MKGDDPENIYATLICNK